ncbi:hypothetical protein C479_09123 [Halovivax asiaticus JCM 14624]|uniref:DUF1684 domain-containing protein n=1 Tax=Halovivax asiaticus JCM 14624 TaxID=1227490 RepID=M0BJD2_9EURY|nr:DUF1684 domain-containing protein [Halovivax asiaticus]ELZ10960.1 hypothetical protein C479_09123 [Halovivax asiaticus JCM 14624]
MTDDVDVDRWRRELAAKRAEKDDFFADHPQSPIPPDERDEFDGLAYFEPDPAYRVTADVTVHDDPDVAYMDTQTGGEMRYLAVATLSTTLPAADPDRDDVPVEIDSYRQEGANDETLFVPFRDKTTGQQTYDGGRYIELAAERSLETGDEIVVDFNLAYTPFCAFSEAFECPKPPETNWLDIAIPAGERTP